MSLNSIWLLSNFTDSRFKEYIVAVVFLGDFANISSMFLAELAKTSESGVRGPKICRVQSGNSFVGFF